MPFASPSPGPQWTALQPEDPGISSQAASSPSPPLGELSDDEEQLPALFHAVESRKRNQAMSSERLGAANAPRLYRSPSGPEPERRDLLGSGRESHANNKVEQVGFFRPSIVASNIDDTYFAYIQPSPPLLPPSHSSPRSPSYSQAQGLSRSGWNVDASGFGGDVDFDFSKRWRTSSTPAATLTASTQTKPKASPPRGSHQSPAQDIDINIDSIISAFHQDDLVANLGLDDFGFDFHSESAPSSSKHANAKESSGEPVLEYYDEDREQPLSPSSPQRQRQRQSASQTESTSVQRSKKSKLSTSAPASPAAARRKRRRPHAAERLGLANTKAKGKEIEDMDVDVILILSSEDEEDNAFYYRNKIVNSNKKSKPGFHRDLNGRTIGNVGEVGRGKVVFVDPDVIELSDSPDPPAAPPPRPLPRPLHRPRPSRSPSLPSYSDSPPRTPRTPHASRPTRTPLFLPSPTPQRPQVQSAPVFRSRKSVHSPTYTPTPIPSATTSFKQKQVARRAEKETREREEREKMYENKNGNENENEIIELSDTPDLDHDFVELIGKPQKRKRKTQHVQESPPKSQYSHSQSTSTPKSTPKSSSTTSGLNSTWQTARKSASTSMLAPKPWNRNPTSMSGGRLRG